MPIILGSPFLATGGALVDMEKGQMEFLYNNEKATFNVCRTMRQSNELQSVSAISHKEKVKKKNEQKIAKQEFRVGDLVLVDSSGSPWSGQAQVQMDWPLLDYPSIPSWSS